MKPSILMAPVVGRLPASPHAIRGVEPVALWDFAQGITPAGFQVQRASTAISIQPSGHWSTVPAQTPRFDGRGQGAALWGEPAGRNLLAHSAAVLGAGWSASGAGATAGALGALGVFPGVEVTSAGATWHRLLHSVRPTVVAGQSYHLTFWVVMGSSGAARCILRNNAAGTETAIRATPAGTTAEQSAAGSVSSVQGAAAGVDGVWVVHLTYVPNFSGALNLGIGPGSATRGESVTVLGAQLELGPVGSSYIATTGAAADRTAEAVIWGAPHGVWDVAITDGDGVRYVAPGVTVGSGWQPASAPFKLAQVGLYPPGTVSGAG